MKKSLFALLVCIAPFCVLAQLPSYLPTDGLVGWWPFNGNANDESGNGNDGTVYGATLSEDRFGNLNSCYYFYDNHIQLPNTFGFTSPTGEFTVSIWFNSTFTVNPQQYFLDLRFGNQVRIVLDKFNTLDFNVEGPMGGGVVNGPTFSNFMGEWTCMVGVVKQNNLFLYLNGQLVNSNVPNINFTIPFSADNGICNSCGNEIYRSIGATDNLYPNQFTIGKIDDIAIYNRALTQEEITALYTANPTNGGGGGNNTASANVPQGVSYQAVARNPQGQPLSNTALQVKFTLLSDSLTGAAEYSELHSLTTNDLGLFTTAFGTGTPLSGSFANINWAGGNKFVKIEADQGSGFIEMGTQQMLSVPYSMRSQTSATIQNNALPVFANNAAALAGGLQAGQMYRTATGDLKIVY